MICRLLGREAIDAMHEIELASFAIPWTHHALYQDVCENACATYHGLYDGEILVGYCGLWVILDEAHVTNIAIRPDYRGQGLGKELLSQVIAWAKQRGVCTISLEVRISNVPALRLYEGLGFVRMGVRKKYYSDNGEDAYLMLLRLGGEIWTAR